MKKHLEHLIALTNKESRLIIGLMSGTSLDGVDIGLCRISGEGYGSKAEVLAFKTISYPDHLQQALLQNCFKKSLDGFTLTKLHQSLATFYADNILKCLEEWNISKDDIDLISSHGQTIFHIDQDNDVATLQMGDGDHIAQRTGIITLSDLRQKQVALGGRGAPLAPYADLLLFQDDKKDRVLVNIGGISNVTYIPHRGSTSSIWYADVGPGNCLMNQYIHRLDKSLYFDQDGQMAAKGKVDAAFLEALMRDEYLHKTLPKTTGPEYYHLKWLARAFPQLNELCPEDVMATLNRYTAEAIAFHAHKLIASKDYDIYIAGGGAFNKTLMSNLKEQFAPNKVYSHDALGIDPDAKEVVLFALLANESIMQDQSDFDHPMFPKGIFGKLSFPD